MIVVLALVTSVGSWAQRIENASVQQVDHDFLIVFDLIPKNSIQERYEVILTADDGVIVQTLQLTDGTLQDVRPGNGLQFRISGRDSFKDFRGEVSFGIEAKMIYSPIRFITPDNNARFDKGKEVHVTWEGGIDGDEYAVELYQDYSKLSILATDIQDSTFSWNIPKDTKPGRKYKLRVVSNNHLNQSAITPEFTIKQKIPIVIKLVPLLAIGGWVYMINKNDNGGNGFPNPPVLPD